MAYTMSDKARAARKLGGKARAKQFTAESQASAGRVRGNSMTREEHVALGRAGYKAMVEKYGRDRAIELVKNYQLANPSDLEQLAAKLLDEMGIAYECQVQVFLDRGILIDMYLPRYGVYLDINGIWHDKNERTRARDLYVTERMAFMGKRYFVLRYDEIDNWERIIKTSLGIEP